jgi:hypothetical protein
VVDARRLDDHAAAVRRRGPEREDVRRGVGQPEGDGGGPRFADHGEARGLQRTEVPHHLVDEVTGQQGGGFAGRVAAVLLFLLAHDDASLRFLQHDWHARAPLLPTRLHLLCHRVESELVQFRSPSMEREFKDDRGLLHIYGYPWRMNSELGSSPK